MVPHCVRKAIRWLSLFAPVALLLLTTAHAWAASSYTLFESGQVRPLALSPDGQHLFAVNTPDNRLEIYRVQPGGLSHLGAVTVGLEPVAVAARGNGEVWVVNHLSDSVSVVDVTHPLRPRVVRTLLVGDEPRDIVFGGPARSRAFITTAHRGQNIPFDPQLTTPGVGRADVWVFDAGDLGETLEGTPINIITLFTDTPRALAVSPDGATVYAAGFHTGNQTTSIHRFLVDAGAGLPPPTTNFLGEPQPLTALIVKYDGVHWVDTIGRVWDDAVKLSLPDKDVFVIDAMASPPDAVPGAAGFVSGVGTILYNMAVHPVSGKVYVTNTEALNLDRFEGPGVFAGTTVRGHVHESRITILSNGGVTPRHLNKHINYASCCAPTPNPENEKSLATPLGMAFTSDGATLYVAALGSSKIGIFNTAALENDTFVPSVSDQISVADGGEPTGPTGLVLDEPRHRLYVLTRFDNSIAVVSTDAHAVISRVPMHNPEPPSVLEGRQYLYDASFSSSHGDSSCASCHVFGDLDSLAWDLGNPDETTLTNPGPFNTVVPPFPADNDFKPLKGPTTTQSLRGMANHGPLHWRGDRTGGNDAPTAQPDSGSFDERAGFEKFQAGFVGLLGRDAPIPADDMETFTDFIMQLMYPPNPIRNLDNSLTADQQAGRDHLLNEGSGGLTSCEFCHRLDPDANAEFGVELPGFFGTDGQSVGQEVGQSMKIPHFRNLYQKVGMFGMGAVPTIHPGDNGFKGDQVRGFGYTHDGSHDTVFRFTKTVGFEQSEFTPNGFDDSPGGDGDVRRRQVEQFLLAFDSNLAPIVGQQVTLTHTNAAVAGPRIDLLEARADAGECDLAVKAPLLHDELGFLYIGGGYWIASRESLPPLHDDVIRALAHFLWIPVTYTCAPPGSGERFAIDRDEDGVLDGDEVDAGTDPADPDSP